MSDVVLQEMPALRGAAVSSPEFSTVEVKTQLLCL